MSNSIFQWRSVDLCQKTLPETPLNLSPARHRSSDKLQNCRTAQLECRFVSRAHIWPLGSYRLHDCCSLLEEYATTTNAYFALIGLRDRFVEPEISRGQLGAWPN